MPFVLLCEVDVYGYHTCPQTRSSPESRMEGRASKRSSYKLGHNFTPTDPPHSRFSVLRPEHVHEDKTEERELYRSSIKSITPTRKAACRTWLYHRSSQYPYRSPSCVACANYTQPSSPDLGKEDSRIHPERRQGYSFHGSAAVT